MGATRESYSWSDPNTDSLIRRIPDSGTAFFRMGSEVVVEEGQAAVFVLDGRAVDGFGPGRHGLSTRTLPIITRVLGLPYGSGDAFEGSLCFVREDELPGLRWGTPIPVAFRDNMFGVIHLRAFGRYAMRIVNPPVFLNTLGRVDGTRHADVEEGVRMLVSSRLTDALSERVDTLIDLPRYTSDVQEIVARRVAEDLAVRGATLRGFSIESITLPDDVHCSIDARGGVGSVDQLCAFFRDETARVLLEASEDGGLRGELLEICDAGEGDGTRSGWGAQGEAGDEASRRCGACHTLLASDARYCTHCGRSFFPQNPCLVCGQANAPEAAHCMRCARRLGEGFACPSCETGLPPGARFCTACGNATAAPDSAILPSGSRVVSFIEEEAA